MTSGWNSSLHASIEDTIVEVYNYKREDIIILLDDDTSPHPPPTRENIVSSDVVPEPKQFS